MLRARLGAQWGFLNVCESAARTGTRPQVEHSGAGTVGSAPWQQGPGFATATPDVKEHQTPQDQEPSTQQVLFCLLLSRPQDSFCFLKKCAMASSRRSPRAPRCLDVVVLRCDLPMSVLATLDALIKVTGRRCREDDCVAAPRSPTGQVLHVHARERAARIGRAAPHRLPRSGRLPREGNPKPAVAVAASPGLPGIALRISRRWDVLGKSGGCSQSSRWSRCHAAVPRQQPNEAEGIRNCTKKPAWLEGIPLQHPCCWYVGSSPGPSRHRPHPDLQPPPAVQTLTSSPVRQISAPSSHTLQTLYLKK